MKYNFYSKIHDKDETTMCWAQACHHHGVFRNRGLQVQHTDAYFVKPHSCTGLIKFFLCVFIV